MQCTKLKTYMETGRVIFLPPRSICPNPAQPRKFFSEESLSELADSIRIHGILQPLSVRRVDAHYELIAGERRYRAAQLAGLREIPCIVMRMDDRESGLTALLENLQRQDLSFIEEARAYSRLMSDFSLSQEQVAKAVGKSQSAVANKLRLLRHSEPVLSKLLEGNLTERHARALLKLDDECKKLAAISHITRGHLSVAQTEAYVESLLTPAPQSLPLMREVAVQRADGGRENGVPPSLPCHPEYPRPSSVIPSEAEGSASPKSTDSSAPHLRCYAQNDTAGSDTHAAQKHLRRIHRAVTGLQNAGIAATVTRQETPTHITITLTLPK